MSDVALDFSHWLSKGSAVMACARGMGDTSPTLLGCAVNLYTRPAHAPVYDSISCCNLYACQSGNHTRACTSLLLAHGAACSAGIGLCTGCTHEVHVLFVRMAVANTLGLAHLIIVLLECFRIWLSHGCVSTSLLRTTVAGVSCMACWSAWRARRVHPVCVCTH